MNDAVMTHSAITLIPEEVAAMKENIRQTEAIFALEGFQPDAENRAIDAAVLAGRVTRDQVMDEMTAYAIEHKTIRGFLGTRSWRLPT